MKHYGDIDLNDNLIQRMVLHTESNFPEVPKAGRIVFKDKKLYICAEIAVGLPVWIPLTNEIDTFVFTQAIPSDTWTITHNLNTINPVIQVYDQDHKMFIPDVISPQDNNTMVVTFPYPVSGRGIVMFGDIHAADKTSFAFEQIETSPTITWVIPHNLGYFPLVRVFIGNSEIQPSQIVHDSIYQTTITFTSPQTGTARLS